VTESGQKARDAAEHVIAVCGTLDRSIRRTFDSFADVRTQWAGEMGLTRIGEAVNRAPDEVLESSWQPGGGSSACATSPPTSTPRLLP
jgi:hypothetical protein